MSHHDSQPRRRAFLGGSLSLAALATAPALLGRTPAAAAAPRAANRPALAGAVAADPPATILIHLAGGNDAFNTLVPYADDAYHRARPTLAIAPRRVLRLDDQVGLHPSLTGLRELFDRGELELRPGRLADPHWQSHCRATEAWASELATLHSAPPQPVGDGTAASFAPLLRHLADRLATAPVGCHLVRLPGFDTHQHQAARHADLLRTFGDGLAALVADLRRHRVLDRVRLVACSEFGRSATENRVGGTDHGVASLVILAGAGSEPGLRGEPMRVGA